MINMENKINEQATQILMQKNNVERLDKEIEGWKGRIKDL